MVIKAEVQGVTPALSTAINLTVAQQPLFVRLGASHLIGTPDDTKYAKGYTALVTDAAGNPVEGAVVTLRVIPTHYDRGVRIFFDPVWVAISSIDGTGTGPNLNCINEDLNKNGILDAGEDTNNDGFLTPGNIATVPQSEVSDENGFATFDVRYARDFADWAQVDLTATVGAVGSESTDIANFVLPALATDVNQEDVGPPGAISPFGKGVTCAAP